MKSLRNACKSYLIIGSLIFGMIFGAGNLVFPVHLGQLAGQHWLGATGGFILSGALLPLLALLAIGITRSRGLYELALPVGPRFSLLFVVLVYSMICLLCATPRTATVPYAIGIAPYLSPKMQPWGLFAYTGIFFILVYFLAVREGKITEIIGKILNPLFLVMLFVIFFLAFIRPMGSLTTSRPTALYVHHAFLGGFLQGYNTMDALAMLIFGVAIITAVQQMGYQDRQAVSLATTKGGIVAILGVGVIYLGLIYLGTTSRAQFALASNGGTTLNQIAHYYLGNFGNALLLTLATITCMTTAMGLVSAFAQDFHDRFPRISYKAFLRFNCLVSFIIANLGLDQIVRWSNPVLMFLYPLAIVLIVVAILSPLFHNAALVYRVSLAFTIIPALFDMVNALPPVLRRLKGIQALVTFADHFLPFFAVGFAWLPFAICGLIVGVVCHMFQKSSRH